jgi:hypothetical protein
MQAQSLALPKWIARTMAQPARWQTAIYNLLFLALAIVALRTNTDPKWPPVLWLVIATYSGMALAELLPQRAATLRGWVRLIGNLLLVSFMIVAIIVFGI